MRITEKLLKKYIELEAKKKVIIDELEAIRNVIIADGRKNISMGCLSVCIENVQRTIPKTRDEIIAEIGAKACARIMKSINYHKVLIRKVR